MGSGVAVGRVRSLLVPVVSAVAVGGLAAGLLAVPPVRASLSDPVAVGVENGSLVVFSQSGAGWEPSTVATGLPVDDAALSPDGSLVVFTTLSSGVPRHVYTMPLATGVPSRVFSADWVSDPSFAHDGESVVVATTGVARPAKRPFVMVLSLSGEPLLELRNLQPAYDPALSPDGRSVAFAGGVAGVDARFPLMVAALDRSAVPKEVSAGASGGVADVVWSSDGKVIGASKLSGEHTGVALFTPWGSCSRDVLFTNQPPGRNNGLLYRFAGFADSAVNRMWTLLEDSQSSPTRFRMFEFTADVCGANEIVPPTPLLDQPFSQLKDVSGPDAAVPGVFAPLLPPSVDVTHQAGALSVAFTAPVWPLGAQSTMVRFAKGDAPGSPQEGSLAFSGFAASGLSPAVAPSTVYGVSLFTFSPDGSWQVTSTSYRTPDASRFADVRVQRDGDRQVVSGRLLDALSSTPVPFVFVELQARSGKRFETVGATSTDASGVFSLSSFAKAGKDLRVWFPGDRDRFAAVADLAGEKASVSLRVSGRLVRDGAKVRVPVTVALKPAARAQFSVEARVKSRWRPVASGRLNASGRASVTAVVSVPAKVRSLPLRVRVPASDTFEAAVSKSVQVQVPKPPKR